MGVLKLEYSVVSFLPAATLFKALLSDNDSYVISATNIMNYFLTGSEFQFDKEKVRMDEEVDDAKFVYKYSVVDFGGDAALADAFDSIEYVVDIADGTNADADAVAVAYSVLTANIAYHTKSDDIQSLITEEKISHAKEMSKQVFYDVGRWLHDVAVPVPRS